MLVLSRKKNEAIIINGGEIEVVVVEVGAGKVRLGINAPREISVDRSEVYEAKRRNPQTPNTEGSTNGHRHDYRPA